MIIFIAIECHRKKYSFHTEQIYTETSESSLEALLLTNHNDYCSPPPTSKKLSTPLYNGI